MADKKAPPNTEQASLALINLVSQGKTMKEAREILKKRGVPATEGAQATPPTPLPDPTPDPTPDPVIEDEVSKMTDDELKQFYMLATDNKTVPHNIKRSTMEVAVREHMNEKKG